MRFALTVHCYVTERRALRSTKAIFLSLKKTCRHSMKLDEKQFNVKLCKSIFIVSAIWMWNSLSQLVVSARSVIIFQKNF